CDGFLISRLPSELQPNTALKLTKNFCDQRIGILSRRCTTTEISGNDLTTTQNGRDSRIQTMSFVNHPNMFEHLYTGTKQQRRGVSQIFTGNIRRRSVNSFKHRSAITDVCTRRKTQATDQASRQIRKNISKKVRRDDHVELLRTLHKLHCHIIDNDIIKLN